MCRISISDKEIDRFWKKVNIRSSDECWEWMASCNKKGYGRVKAFGTMTLAHRVSFFISNGYLTDGLFVCHTCDNPSCCNPIHLWEGTNDDNMQDCIAKGRHISQNPSSVSGENHFYNRKPELRPKGEKNSRAKLKDADVIEIIRMTREGIIPRNQIALMYGVSKGVIGKIAARLSWKHLTCPKQGGHNGKVGSSTGDEQ